MTKISPKKVKLKAKSDLVDLVLTKLKATKPKDPGCTYEFARSTQQVLSRIRYVLRSGIEPLDEAVGGIAFGRVCEIYGLEGCGKSALVQLLAAQGQRREIYERLPGNKWRRVPEDADWCCVYIDNEQSVDDDGKLTVNGTEIDVVLGRCDTVDQMFKIVDNAIDTIVAATAETGRECFILVIVDTIAGTSSNEEMKADWNKVDYNRQPKQLRQGFRRIVRKLNRHNVAMVCTNQVGDKFGGQKRSYGGSAPREEDFSSFGGKALKFFASQRIFLQCKNPAYKLNPKAANPAGFVTEFLVRKNRLKPPYRAGRFVLLFDRGLTNTFSILETLVHLKLAKVGATEGGGDDAKGALRFRFGAAGITTTTFPAKLRGDPSIESREEWPAFYTAHQADLDALWAAAKAAMFSGTASPGADDDANDDDANADDDASDVDLDEETLDAVAYSPGTAQTGPLPQAVLTALEGE